MVHVSSFPFLSGSTFVFPQHQKQQIFPGGYLSWHLGVSLHFSLPLHRPYLDNNNLLARLQYSALHNS